MNIRTADLNDLEDIIQMLYRASRELPDYKDLGFSVPRVAEQIAALIMDERGVVYLAEVDGVAVGIIAGVLIEYWFNDDSYATDLVLYVEPDHRIKNYGYRLIKQFVDWAKAKEISEILTGVSSGVDIEKAGKLFQRIGFEYRGKTYSMKRED